MAKYVYADNVKNAMKELCEKFSIAYADGQGGFGDELSKIIDKQVAADVAPVIHAHWEIGFDGYYPRCSRCGGESEKFIISKFCPNCGAKMDKE